MPRRAARPCSYPGCTWLVHDPARRFCPRHLSEYRRRQDARRPSSSARGYNAAWRAARVKYLADHPVCERCQAPAEIVHHIRAKRAGGSDDPENLLALCVLCHAQIEAQAGTLFAGQAQQRR